MSGNPALLFQAENSFNGCVFIVCFSISADASRKLAAFLHVFDQREKRLQPSPVLSAATDRSRPRSRDPSGVYWDVMCCGWCRTQKVPPSAAGASPRLRFLPARWKRRLGRGTRGGWKVDPDWRDRDVFYVHKRLLICAKTPRASLEWSGLTKLQTVLSFYTTRAQVTAPSTCARVSASNSVAKTTVGDAFWFVIIWGYYSAE